MSDLWFLSAEEKARVRAYDEQCRLEIEAENHPPARRDILQELKTASEAEALASIRYWMEDIGALLAVREKWPTDPAIRDRVNFLIRMAQYEIDNLMEEIQSERQS